jgi:hypothetical protein
LQKETRIDGFKIDKTTIAGGQATNEGTSVQFKKLPETIDGIWQFFFGQNRNHCSWIDTSFVYSPSSMQTHYALYAFALSNVSEKKIISIAPKDPELLIDKVTVQTDKAVRFNFRMASLTRAVTDVGICWSRQSNPDLSDAHVSLGSTDSLRQFMLLIDTLKHSATYYVRMYAKDFTGVFYSKEEVFQNTSTSGNTNSPILPTVTTLPMGSIYANTAYSGGYVSVSGSSPVTQRGVCWSRIPYPTINDYFTSNGSGTGSYNSLLTGLVSNTVYYVRAYARNSEGLSYGDQVSFRTN